MKRNTPSALRGLGDHHIDLLRRLADGPVKSSYNTTHLTVCGQHVGALVRRGLAERLIGGRVQITGFGRIILAELEQGL